MPDWRRRNLRRTVVAEMSVSPPAMPAPRCTECGSPLAVRVLAEGVVTVGDLSVPFRRETDFVLCERCLATFRVEDVRDGLSRPV
jgi:uncharacterized protein with PIN domain